MSSQSLNVLSSYCVPLPTLEIGLCVLSCFMRTLRATVRVSEHTLVKCCI